MSRGCHVPKHRGKKTDGMAPPSWFKTGTRLSRSSITCLRHDNSWRLAFDPGEDASRRPEGRSSPSVASIEGSMCAFRTSRLFLQSTGSTVRGTQWVLSGSCQR